MLVQLAVEEGLKLGDFELARVVSEVIEVIAIAVISIAVVAAVIGGLVRGLQGYLSIQGDADSGFDVFKAFIARGLLVGLDLLIAADIIKTVTVEATIENAVVLGLLVLIRTFLSWTLYLEIEERWPWQPKPAEESGGSNVQAAAGDTA